MLGGCGRPQAGHGGRAGRRGNKRQQRREHDIQDEYYTDSDDESDVSGCHNHGGCMCTYA